MSYLVVGGGFSKSAPQAMSQCKAVTVKDAFGRPQPSQSKGVRAIARCGLLRQEVFQSRPRAILQIEGKKICERDKSNIQSRHGLWHLDLGLDQLGLECTREAKAQSSTSKAPTARPGCCPFCLGRARRSKTCLEGKGALRLFASNPQVRQAGASAAQRCAFSCRRLPAFCGELCAPSALCSRSFFRCSRFVFSA